jgi:hypothetical protein
LRKASGKRKNALMRAISLLGAVPSLRESIPAQRFALLRTIATSVAEAGAIVFGAALCLIVIKDVVAWDSFGFGPLLLLVVYPLPIGIAALRKHNALLDIMITNFWLGWTVVGWIFSLVWACDWDVRDGLQ